MKTVISSTRYYLKEVIRFFCSSNIY